MKNKTRKKKRISLRKKRFLDLNNNAIVDAYWLKQQKNYERWSRKFFIQRLRWLLSKVKYNLELKALLANTTDDLPF